MPHGAAFDHLIHWTDDLARTRAAYDAAALPTQAALTMPGFSNAAWGIDDERYVELATVDDWEAAATSIYAGSLGILRPAIAAMSGPGLVTFAVNVPDAPATAARLRTEGRQVDEIAVRLEEHDAGFVEVFVRDAPSYFPFFITYDPPRAEIGRMRAEHRAAEGISLDGRPDLVALLVASPAPEADARLLGDLVQCPVAGTTVTIPDAEVRFHRGKTVGIYGIAVRGPDLPAGPIDVDGMTVIVEQASHTARS